MAGIDRTAEFFAYIGPNDIAPPQQFRHQDSQERFTKLSTDISTAFDQCNQDLGTLRQLAKHRNLFDDRTADIHELTLRIKQSLTTLNRNVDDMEAVCKPANTGSPGSQHAAAHRQAILNNLRTRILDLTKEFKDILEVRTHNLKQLETRRDLYGHGGSRSSADLPGTLQRRAASNNSNSDNQILDLEAGTGQVLSQQTGYHESRVEAVEQIQRVVGELSTMFSRVAMMVSQQEELVMRIDATVDESLHRLKEGQAHLLRYFQSLTNQRGLILKLLGMVLAFSVFFIIFLA